MTGVATEDIALVALVSFLHCIQLTRAAMKVGDMRRKHKVIPPAVDGPPEFIRAFRAQQNGLEFAPIFQVPLWIAAIFFHQVPAAMIGLLYLYGRSQYFQGYILKAEDRLGGFKLVKRAVLANAVLAFTGISTTLLRTYTGFDLAAMALNVYYGRK